MVRKLALRGHVHNNPHRKVSSFYTWPLGANPLKVEDLIKKYKIAFSNVVVQLEHVLDDDNYPY
jgi:hypothetical protein